MNTPNWSRRWRLVTTLMAGLALGVAGGSIALAESHGGGGGGGGGHFGGGGLHGGGGAHFSARGGYGYRRGGYGYGRGYYGRGYGYGGWGWGGGWWGPGWWGVGLFLPVIPWYYATYWWGGIPYYYGNNAYYVWDGDAGEYEQVTPPADFSPNGPPTSAPDANGAPPATTELFAYPKAGQSPAQQASDVAACRKWASDQVASQGAPGTPPPSAAGAPQSSSGSANGNAAASEAMAKRQAYLRAEGVCLQGRNYSVG
ncbi:MAG: hypothetical protein WBE92_18850 [Steroidobacteraceae bacterium]